MEPSRSESPSEADKVISPFADTQATVFPKKGNWQKLFLALSAGLVLVIVGAIAGGYIIHFLNDPYRTMETFPVSRYLDDYRTLAGSRFKAVFRVEADLGWKDGAGRLMLFSTQDDPRPIAVFIPASITKGIYFTKGQSYIAEIEVKEGGLIYANACEKN